MKMNEFAANFHRPRMGRRLPALAGSLAMMGVCIAILEAAGFGTDPCSTFTLGVSARTGVSFGTCQLALNLLLFLPVLRYDLSRIGIGTIGNMVGVGYVADFTMKAIAGWTPDGGLTMPVRAAMFAFGMVLFLTAASFYMVVDLGVAPYDAIPQLIASRVKKPGFRAVRMLWDLSILSAGFLLGATVGLTTLVISFFLGPAIVFTSGRIKGWFE